MKTKKVNFIFDDAITNYSMNKKKNSPMHEALANVES